MIEITGTLVYYYSICPRQVWLLAHKITADQDDPNVEYGRFLQEHVYERQKKEISIGHLKIDVLKSKDGQLVIGEVKKSSKAKDSSRLQLLFYLAELKEWGIEAEGELLFPEERRREKVILDEAAEKEIEKIKKNILSIIYQELPPPPKKISLCKNCAYRELCWS